MKNIKYFFALIFLILSANSHTSVQAKWKIFIEKSDYRVFDYITDKKSVITHNYEKGSYEVSKVNVKDFIKGVSASGKNIRSTKNESSKNVISVNLEGFYYEDKERIFFKELYYISNGLFEHIKLSSKEKNIVDEKINLKRFLLKNTPLSIGVKK